MIRESATCAGPEDVRRKFRKVFVLPHRELLVITHHEYVVLQSCITVLIESCEEDEEAQLVAIPPPPCVTCPVDVFYYCAESGMECKKFKLYTSGAKGRKHDED